jgi:hypothetical protein
MRMVVGTAVTRRPYCYAIVKKPNSKVSNGFQPGGWGRILPGAPIIKGVNFLKTGVFFNSSR